MSEPSGPAWVARFPTSRTVDTLVEPFHSHVRAFLGALEAGGARVTINATYRPPERAYLMHWAFAIAQGQVDPHNVPPMAGVDIAWNHDGARTAAQQMCDEYGIAYAPVLISRHTQGLAIDMDIAWDGDLAITDAHGHHLAIQTAPRDGTNPALWKIGASFGVIKLPADLPHWSSDGH